MSVKQKNSRQEERRQRRQALIQKIQTNNPRKKHIQKKLLDMSSLTEEALSLAQTVFPSPEKSSPETASGTAKRREPRSTKGKARQRQHEARRFQQITEHASFRENPLKAIHDALNYMRTNKQ